jgi:hypothetical protein
MKTLLKRLLLVAVVAALVVAFVTWPFINDVATGRTPEYPDISEDPARNSSPGAIRAFQRTSESRYRRMTRRPSRT